MTTEHSGVFHVSTRPRRAQKQAQQEAAEYTKDGDEAAKQLVQLRQDQDALDREVIPNIVGVLIMGYLASWFIWWLFVIVATAGVGALVWRAHRRQERCLEMEILRCQQRILDAKTARDAKQEEADEHFREHLAQFSKKPCTSSPPPPPPSGDEPPPTVA